MKLLLAAVTLFIAVGVQSQTTSTEDAMDAQIMRQLGAYPSSKDLFTAGVEKPNEVKVNGLTYSGFFVELIKTDNPLQLINPLAPAEYGSAEDNTARDAITGEPLGFKLFSIQF